MPLQELDLEMNQEQETMLTNPYCALSVMSIPSQIGVYCFTPTTVNKLRADDKRTNNESYGVTYWRVRRN